MYAGGRRCFTVCMEEGGGALLFVWRREEVLYVLCMPEGGGATVYVVCMEEGGGDL